MIGDIKAFLDSVLGFLDRRDQRRRLETPAGHVQTSVDRFKYLVEAHGLKLAQIPGLAPAELSVRLSQLKDDASIAETLTPDFLNWIAGVFGVQRAWLEGASDEVYASIRAAYKYTDKFVAWLREAGWWTEDLRMRVFTTERSLRVEDAVGPIAITMARPLPALPDSGCFQFLPTTDLWMWGHPPCRDSILLLAAHIYDYSGIPIRVYRVPHRTVERIQHRTLIPNPARLKRCRPHIETLDQTFNLMVPESSN